MTPGSICSSCTSRMATARELHLAVTNQRTDAYGGSLENRMRFPLEVFDAAGAWPDHKPMSVRISAVDWAPGGMQPADSVEVARR